MVLACGRQCDCKPWSSTSSSDWQKHGQWPLAKLQIQICACALANNDINIKKARGAFFARGQGVFLGALNPLSSQSIVETCVIPVLLHGAESWIINESLLKSLESFQAELAKRILRLPKFSSNKVARLALLWPSVRVHMLIIKLAFLLKLLTSDDPVPVFSTHSLYWV